MTTPTLLDQAPVLAIPEPVTVALVPATYVEIERARRPFLEITLPTTITTDVEAAELAEQRRAMAAFIKQFKPMFDEVCRDAKGAHTRACELRDTFIGEVAKVEAQAARMLTDYEQRKERARREAEAAERRRLEEEERKRRAAEAKQLEKAGDKGAAQALRQMPIAVPTVVMPAAPKVDTGLSSREDFRWRPIAGDTAQGRELAAKLVPREYLTLDDKKLDAAARTHKGTLSIPGIEFYTVTIPVRR